MSAEYFYVEGVERNHHSKFFEDLSKVPVHHRPEQCRCSKESDSESKRSQDCRLQEIEEQLQIAENRCNTLKGQLDYMKKVYHKASSIDSPRNASGKHRSQSSTPTRNPSDVQQNQNVKYNASSRQPSRDRRRTAYSHSPSPTRKLITDISSQQVRQIPANVNTDTTGAAVRTINNILTGITDSVNRLSELHAHLETSDKKTVMNRKKMTREEKDKSSVFFSEPVVGVEVVNFQAKKSHDNVYRSATLPADRLEASISEEISRKESDVCSCMTKLTTKKRSRLKKNIRTKTQTSVSSINAKKNMKVTARHVEKKPALNPVRTGMMEFEASLHPSRKLRKQVKRLKQSSKTAVRKKDSDTQNKDFQQYTTDNLVELYHNESVRSSDSEESISGIKKSTTTHSKSRQRVGGESSVVPPLKIDVSINAKRDEEEVKRKKQESNTWLSPINEQNYYEPTAPRGDGSNMCNMQMKSYELPTISSKMKQVTKCYLQSFNFKTIPFCAAKSTSPSHNIGINIQQVMSIMKTKQPIQGLSPTLAHNIGLAAEKFNSKGLSTFVSSLSSRMWCNKSQCPLIRNPMNFQQLQEMAKEIPEEDENMAGDNEDNNGEVENTIANGPSGDNEQNQDKENLVWTADPSQQKNCTCISPNGVAFNHVLSRYHTSQTRTTVQYSMPPLKQLTMPKRQYMNEYRNSRQSMRAANIAAAQQAAQEAEHKLDIKEDTKPLQGREKTLKEVLKNLYNDFNALNAKYEDLSTQAREGTIETNEETLKQLEDMEKTLTNKEEEIQMVMALYQEVVALKKQVKTLKERTSQATFHVRDSLSGFRQYKDPTAAFHLTKLLRQIQNYQLSYKKGGGAI